MLRKMRLTAPADRYDDLLAAARHAHLELDDYCVDTSPSARWPYTGDGHAVVIALVDDTHESGQEIQAALRNAHEILHSEPGDFIRFARSYVALPDGLDPSDVEHLTDLAEALHAAEAAHDTTCSAELRALLQGPLSVARTVGETAVTAFVDALVMDGVLPISDI